jgi:hypothetical protein
VGIVVGSAHIKSQPCASGSMSKKPRRWNECVVAGVNAPAKRREKGFESVEKFARG